MDALTNHDESKKPEPTSIDTDARLLEERLRAGMDLGAVARVLAQAHVAVHFAEVVTGLLGTADREAVFGEPALVLSGLQRSALLDGLHLTTKLVGERLGELYEDQMLMPEAF